MSFGILKVPIYEYRCTSCNHELEALRKVSDPPLTLCPSCSTENLVKKVSAAAFRLKGSGWYETDFKSKGQKNLAGDAAKPDTTSTPAAVTSKPSTTSTTSAASPAASSTSKP